MRKKHKANRNGRGQQPAIQAQKQELALKGDLKILIERLQYFLNEKGDLPVIMRLSDGGACSSIRSMFEATIDELNGFEEGAQVVVLAGYVPDGMRSRNN
jgi:hypothetical protein